MIFTHALRILCYAIIKLKLLLFLNRDVAAKKLRPLTLAALQFEAFGLSPSQDAPALQS